MSSLDRLLMIVEDDVSFGRALRKSFERRGYRVTVRQSLEDVEAALPDAPPCFAIVDLKLVGPSGLECIKSLLRANPSMSIVVLTGYASIATAVEAIKLGACHYLVKPSSVDDIEAALLGREANGRTAFSERKNSIKTVEWERIHETLMEVNFNVSEAARRLGMHRRTLARKLAKRQIT
ncbi:response regulator transcription factor [Methylosinus sp. H3A]|uniref:response regulator transcription factor n=1 Tax=Methylosinus sp. H3A TaxID=2785786 RepID=UPI001FEF9A53|nr:response regulator transcription factor [Methylosinus sp. H3A]